MNAKMLEIRDVATFIPVLAIQLEPDGEPARWLLAKAGFGRDSDSQKKYILLCQIAGGADRCATDWHKWGIGTRTYTVAHQYISRYWDELESGSVVCVEYLLGERETPKTSERLEQPGGDE